MFFINAYIISNLHFIIDYIVHNLFSKLYSNYIFISIYLANILTNNQFYVSNHSFCKNKNKIFII